MNEKRHCYICGNYLRPGGPRIDIRPDASRHVRCEPGSQTFFKKAPPKMVTQYLDNFRRNGEPDEAVKKRLGVGILT